MSHHKINHGAQHKIKPIKSSYKNKVTFTGKIFNIHQLSKIVMSFWIGGSLMMAIVVFPLLFQVVDIVVASNLVGTILNILGYIGIVCLTVALIEVIINHKLSLLKTRRFWYIVSMGGILIINYFAIFPSIAKLKQQISSVAHQVIAVQDNLFDFWHSLSAITFIVVCIIGFLYLIDM